MRVKLGDLVEEYSERNSENKYKPVAVGKYGIRARESIYSKELAKDYSKNKVIRKGTLTVGMGSNQIDIGIMNDDEVYSVSPAYHTYKIKISNYEYLDYLLAANNARMFSLYANRGSRQGKTLDLKRWLTDELKIHDESEQKAIVDNLKNIKVLIRRKEELLLKLDELVKARFVEMFGDPSKGDKVKTHKRKIGEIASVTKLAGFEFTKYIHYQEEGDIIMLRGLNCKNGHLVLNDIKWIDQATSDALPRSKLYKGDILMTYAGTIGDVAMVDKDNTYHLAPNVGKISINNTSEVNPVFLTQLFLNTHDYIMSFASQVAQASINMQKIRDFEYYFPSIKLQNEFADFVAQVDKSKFTIQKSLEKTQLLFDSLMQEYFG